MEITLNYNYPLGVEINKIIKEIELIDGKIISYTTDFMLSINIEVKNQKDFEKKYDKINTCKTFYSVSRKLSKEETEKIDWSTMKNNFEI